METGQKRERLASLLIDFAEKEGLSGHQLSRRIGVSQPSTRAYLDGVTYPSEETRRKIAKAMGLTFEEFQSKIDDTVVQRERTTEEVCREIRIMSDEDFVEVAGVVFERSLAQLQLKAHELTNQPQ